MKSVANQLFDNAYPFAPVAVSSKKLLREKFWTGEGRTGFSYLAWDQVGDGMWHVVELISNQLKHPTRDLIWDTLRVKV